MNEDELKQLLLHKLDVLEFLDTAGISYEELIDTLFDDLNEEQRQELIRAVND